MSASVHLDQGRGPGIVLLHGVGAGPESFAPLVGLLAGHHRCLVVARPGGGGGAAEPLAEQADAVAALVTEVGAAGSRLVGVSGGATLGLAIAMAHPDLFADLLLHEPLVGRHAPALHVRFQQAAARAQQSTDAALEVVREVMGATAWEALGAEGRRDATAQAARWQAEIATFAAFDPPVAGLDALRRQRILVTVGGASGPDRRQAAAALQRLAGASCAVVPGSGNAAHLDAPGAFAQIIRSHLITPVEGSR